MAHPWPLFDLRLRTPRLELRVPADDDLLELAAIARAGLHDPDVHPFLVPWDELPIEARVDFVEDVGGVFLRRLDEDVDVFRRSRHTPQLNGEASEQDVARTMLVESSARLREPAAPDHGSRLA